MVETVEDGVFLAEEIKPWLVFRLEDEVAGVFREEGGLLFLLEEWNPQGHQLQPKFGILSLFGVLFWHSSQGYPL